MSYMGCTHRYVATVNHRAPSDPPGFIGPGNGEIISTINAESDDFDELVAFIKDRQSRDKWASASISETWPCTFRKRENGHRESFEAVAVTEYKAQRLAMQKG